MSTDLLEINEIFGPTIQGEGTAAGQHCLFVRTFQCNLRCKWCDTAKTWAVYPALAEMTEEGKLFELAEQRKYMSTDDVIAALQDKWDVKMQPTNIIFSGGEPMMQARKLQPLARQLFEWGNNIHIETAGTIKTLPELDVVVAQYSVSPKLANSGNDFKKRYKPEVLENLMRTGKARFKFVVRSSGDFAEIDYIVADVGIPKQHVQVMPEGTKATHNIATAQAIIGAALARGYGLSFRSHILIWGNKEGV